MTQVTPGIYQLQLPITGSSLKYVNAYLIQGDNECLLIDTGWNAEETFESLKEQLAAIGIGFGDISQIIITHIHPDHYGLAGRLKQLSQAKIILHRREKELIESRYINMNQFIQQIQQWLHINGAPANELSNLQISSAEMSKLADPIFPDVTLNGNEIISIGAFNFKVIWTPGHSPGHITLYEPNQKILISGDHILPTITPNISLYHQSGDNPLDDYLNSLNRLKQLEVNLILTGHEHPFTGLQPRIEELLQHHQQRNREILGTIKNKPKTAYQISTEMTWASDIGGFSWDDLKPLDKRLAVMEALAHLESMRVDGKVDKFLSNSTTYYQTT